ncbi:MAG TPA: GPW/gp25 family protein [Thermoanaerobaculia bacterium]|nr:GPW/gp25 family protein [Thermoanaerobaculia bacterium]
MNIDFPLHFDSRGRTAECNDAAHVRNMLEQLLFTNAGERVNRPDFGSGLQQLVFAPNSPELAAVIQFTTRAAIQQWLSDVLELQALDVISDDAALRISITYALRPSGEVRTESFVRSVS